MRCLTRNSMKTSIQLASAMLLTCAVPTVLANDFYLESNLLTIKNTVNGVTTTIAEATLGSNGVLTTEGANLPRIDVDNDALTDGLPSFEFTIDTDGLEASSSNTFKIGLSIVDDASPTTRRFEAYISELTLAVAADGTTVTGTIPAQSMNVLAKKGSATFYQAIENSAVNGPVTISGGTLSFNGEQAVTLLKAAGNDVLDAVIDDFTLSGSFTFRIVMEETSNGSARVGVKSGSTFTKIPRISASCTLDSASTIGNVFTLTGDSDFSIADQFSNAYVVQGRFSSNQDADNTAATAFTEDCSESSGGDDAAAAAAAEAAAAAAEAAAAAAAAAEAAAEAAAAEAAAAAIVESESAVEELSSVLDTISGSDSNEPIDEEQLAQIDTLNDAISNLAEQIDSQIDAELESDTLSEATVTSSSNLATASVASTNAIVNSISAGSTVSTTNILSALTAGSKTSASSAKVAAAVTDTTAKAALVENNKTILNNSAALLSALTTSDTALTSDEATAVRSVASNIVNTSKSLGAALETAEEILDVVAQTNSVLEANEELGVAADDALIESVGTASEAIATSFISKQLAAEEGEEIEAAVITEAITESQELFEAVLDVGLRVPPAVIVTAAETSAAVETAYPTIQPATAARVATAAKKIVNPNNIRLSSNKTLLASMTDFLTSAFGSSASSLISPPGTKVSALSLPSSMTGTQASALTDGISVAVDSATGGVIISLPGESYAAVISGVRNVPAVVPNGVRFRADGRATLVTDGVAIDLAPAAYNLVNFIDAVEAAGYSYSQNPNATFTVDLGDGSTFVGTFAYDNLTDADLTSACDTVSVTTPTGPINAPGYSFGVVCANGVSQTVVPSLANPSFLSSIKASGLTATVDRNTGIISVDSGVGQLKPSFFTATPTAAELEFHATEKDSFGIATQLGDINGDGISDYKVISSDSVQILYGVAS